MAMAQAGLDGEALRRLDDRLRVEAARRRSQRLRLLWLVVGPGLLVMLGENDGPSMLSYAATGARYGVGMFVPFVVATFVMAYVVQEATVRLGAATKTGHAALIYRRFGPLWGHFAMIDLVVTNLLTLVAEYAAIAAGAGYFGLGRAPAVAIGFALVAAAPLLSRYRRWERLALALAALNLLFVPVALLSHPHWGAIGRALVTAGPLPGRADRGLVALLLSDIGATITPWMLYFQQGAVSDKGLTRADVRLGRADTALGAGLAAIAAIACIVATAPLARHIGAGAYDAARFAQALVPYAGRVGAALFALALADSGLVALGTIATSSAYAFAEVVGGGHSLNRGVAEAPAFYAAMLVAAALAGAALLAPALALEGVAVFVNVLAVLTMPPALVFLLLLVRDREVMGDLANSRRQDLCAGAVVAFVCLAGVAYAVSLLVR
jgi:Mn2+/Fe2+ NRAMP family transporter